MYVAFADTLCLGGDAMHAPLSVFCSSLACTCLEACREDCQRGALFAGASALASDGRAVRAQAQSSAGTTSAA